MKCKRTNHLHHGKCANLKRIFWYFCFPLSIIVQRRKFDRIIGWQQFYGLNTAFFFRLFRMKKLNRLYVMTFIYRKRHGLLGSLYHRYMRFIVTSRYIDRIICFSRDEVAYYSSVFGVDKDKFVFVPLGIRMAGDIEVRDEGYVFSTGRSNRDYGFLLEVLKGMGHKAIIACDTYANSTTAPDVDILTDCHGDDMERLMAKCHIVVIPLKDANVSSGQLVLLRAMSLGKPVVCTASNGVRDYIVDRKTGLLVDNDRDEWREAINGLYENRTFYKELSDNSKKIFQEHFSDEAMYKKIAQVVRKDERIG